jgi:phosphohistidine phosphatase SixA
MRELVILRHAHAEPQAPGQRDFDRALSRVGRSEAEAVARWLEQHELRFDRVLCSPAVRARTTAQLALGHDVAESLHPAIYEATPGALIDLLERDAGTRTLLVGHNPGLEQLLALLTEGRSTEYRGVPPAGVAWLGWPEDRGLEPGCATLRAFWSP